VRVVLAIASATVVALVGGSAATTQTLPIRDTQVVQKAEKQETAAQRARQTQLKQLAQKVATFRTSTWACQDTLGISRTRASASVWALPQSITYRGWVVEQWQKNTRSCLKLQQQRAIPSSNDWATAVSQVQRVFPGTESWLLSCSSAEGGHGRWVTYGGGSYYPGFEDRYTVGGPLQYKWPTFKGHYRHALESLRSRGFIVELAGPEDVQAWLSMTGQALAGGWARWSGNDSSHWSASWGNGC
jgi:hypothetical protein